jgi:hypothetical protein
VGHDGVIAVAGTAAPLHKNDALVIGAAREAACAMDKMMKRRNRYGDAMRIVNLVRTVNAVLILHARTGGFSTRHSSHTNPFSSMNFQRFKT